VTQSGASRRSSRPVCTGAGNWPGGAGQPRSDHQRCRSARFLRTTWDEFEGIRGAHSTALRRQVMAEGPHMGPAWTAPSLPIASNNSASASASVPQRLLGPPASQTMLSRSLYTILLRCTRISSPSRSYRVFSTHPSAPSALGDELLRGGNLCLPARFRSVFPVQPPLSAKPKLSRHPSPGPGPGRAYLDAPSRAPERLPSS